MISKTNALVAEVRWFACVGEEQHGRSCDSTFVGSEMLSILKDNNRSLNVD
jgi:hypothetical protein